MIQSIKIQLFQAQLFYLLLLNTSKSQCNRKYRGMEAIVVKRSLCFESENLSLNLILNLSSWGSLSKLFYPSGPRLVKLLKWEWYHILTGEESNEIVWMKELGEINIKTLLHWLCVITMDKCSYLFISHWHWRTSNIFLPQILICKFLSFKSGLGAILSFLASLPSSLDLIFNLIVAMPFLADPSITD